MGSTSEQIDRELAAAALEKRRRGEKPTGQERAALRRIEKEREEEQRWAYYASVPKKHYVAMSGRPAKVILDQADRYGLPLRGATVDLSAVLKGFHDLLADNKHRLAVVDDPDPLLAGGSSPALERYRTARAEAEELRVGELRRNLLPREDVREGLGRAAALLRSVGEKLKRQFGDSAHAVLDGALGDLQREFDRLCVSEVET